MKWYYFILLCMMFLLLIPLVKGMEGGTIYGDSQVFDNDYFWMNVSPHTSSTQGYAYHTQYYSFRANQGQRLSSRIAFRYDYPLERWYVIEDRHTMENVNGTDMLVLHTYDRSSDFRYTQIGDDHVIYRRDSFTFPDAQLNYSLTFLYSERHDTTKYDSILYSGAPACPIDDTCAWIRVLDPFTSSPTNDVYHFALPDLVPQPFSSLDDGDIDLSSDWTIRSGGADIVYDTTQGHFASDDFSDDTLWRYDGQRYGPNVCIEHRFRLNADVGANEDLNIHFARGDSLSDYFYAGCGFFADIDPARIVWSCTDAAGTQTYNSGFISAPSINPGEWNIHRMCTNDGVNIRFQLFGDSGVLGPERNTSAGTMSEGWNISIFQRAVDWDIDKFYVRENWTTQRSDVINISENIQAYAFDSENTSARLYQWYFDDVFQPQITANNYTVGGCDHDTEIYVSITSINDSSENQTVDTPRYTTANDASSCLDIPFIENNAFDAGLNATNDAVYRYDVVSLPGDLMNSTVVWRVEGSVVDTQTFLSLSNNTQVNSTLGSDNYTFDDVLNVTVTVSNDDGSDEESEEFTMGSALDTPPLTANDGFLPIPLNASVDTDFTVQVLGPELNVMQVNITWTIDSSHVFNESFLGIENGTFINTTLGADNYTFLDTLVVNVTIEDGNFTRSFIFSEDVPQEEIPPSGTELVYGSCPGSTAGMMGLGMLLFMLMFFFVFAFLSGNDMLGFATALGFFMSSFVFMGCLTILGPIMWVLGIIIGAWFVLR